MMSDPTNDEHHVIEPRQDVITIESLSEAQRTAFDAICNGESVMVTGPAGCGKSALLKLIKKHHGTNTFFTSSTGLSATLIGATTVHSFAGVGLATDSQEALLLKVRRDAGALKRWKKVETLVIDEISMIDAILFEKLEYVARMIVNPDLPFGGIQLILVADFLQLKPVQSFTVNEPVRYCFQSEVFKKCINRTVVLDRVFRQSDNKMRDALNKMRVGCLDASVREFFESCVDRTFDVSDGIEPTDLYATKRSVQEINEQRLDAIEEDLYEYVAVDSGKEPFLTQLKKNGQSEANIKLKVGAQVMLTCNLDQKKGLVNGSRGVIVRFEAQSKPSDQGFNREQVLRKRVRSDDVWPIVRFVNGKERPITHQENNIEVNGDVVATRLQIPLILAFALTMHRVQGSQLERIRVHLDGVFTSGQSYVAISRAISAEGLCIVGSIPWNKIHADPVAIAYYEKLASTSTTSNEPTEDEKVKDNTNNAYLEHKWFCREHELSMQKTKKRTRLSTGVLLDEWTCLNEHEEKKCRILVDDRLLTDTRQIK